VTLHNWKGWAMAGEADAYLGAYNEAESAFIALKMMSDEIALVAASLQTGQPAAYQTIPATWPTVEQIRLTQERAREALDEAKQTYSRVPKQLRRRLPKPESIGAGDCENDEAAN
jgi:hypothetical protein